MDETRYKTWWQLHRRVAVGETLSDDEQRDYQAGLAELEAEEQLPPSSLESEWQTLRTQFRELTARKQELIRQEAQLQQYAAELERRYPAVAGEPLLIEV